MDDLIEVKGISKDEVRRLFPTIIAFADEMRAVFGDGVKLVYAEENGYKMGKKIVYDPANSVKLSEMCFDPLVVDEKAGRKRGK